MASLVSVVIPTYDRAHVLARAVDSVLAQSHAEVEAIVVDDGSTDTTPDLLAGRYGGDRRVRVLRQANGGVVAARNAGLALCRGDYVAFLDSDDCWQTWKLELQLAALAACPKAGMVWTDMEAVGPDGAVVAPRYLRTMYSAYRWFPTAAALFGDSRSVAGPLGRVALHVGDIHSQMVMGNLVHTSTVLLRRDRLERVGGFDPALGRAGEDYDFHLRTCREGPVAFLDVASIRYQTGMPDRLTRHSTLMARNFLTTISREVKRDRRRIALPDWMLDEVFAHAHRWLGECLIADGDAAGGRRHTLASLRRRPWQGRPYAQLALTTLPAPWADGLRAGWRRLKLRASRRKYEARRSGAH